MIFFTTAAKKSNLASSKNMDSKEFRAVIKHFHLKGFSAREVKTELDGVHGDASPSFATVKRWIAEFKKGRRSIEDLPRPGRPKSVTHPENVMEVHKMVQENCHVSIREIAQVLKISSERVHAILHDDLCLKKLQAHWVPRELTKEQKLNLTGPALPWRNSKNYAMNWSPTHPTHQTWPPATISSSEISNPTSLASSLQPTMK